jgi:hypothetical protein
LLLDLGLVGRLLPLQHLHQLISVALGMHSHLVQLIALGCQLLLVGLPHLLNLRYTLLLLCLYSRVKLGVLTLQLTLVE